MNILKYTAILIFTILNAKLYADVRLPSILSDHMVLQQYSAVKLWGWSDASETIKISTSWDTVTYQTTGSDLARWSVKIKTPAPGGPYSITIKGNNTVIIQDVMIGEVWACSGQSNMEMSYNWLLNWGSKQYSDVIEKSTNNKIRFFYVPKATSEYPQDDTKGKWIVSNPQDAKNFSLVAYFFGQKLQQQLNTSVGLISSSWGGTPAEVWTPSDSIVKNDVLKAAASAKTPSKYWTITPGSAYNAMIYPLINYSIAGAIWYQGEANVGTPSSYNKLLTTMINSWRSAWQHDFPFYYVQIAPYAGYGKSNSSALLRESQTKVLEVPYTGMIIVHDLVGDINDIHPRNKKDVGIRLANYALAETYGLKGLPYKSPSFKSMKIENNRVRIYFNNAERGLISKEKSITGFYISGDDKVFKPAVAKIEKNTLVVWNPDIKNPVAVRFGFTSSDMPQLYSKEGLPVNIFRTDNWDTINTLPN